MRVTNAPPAWLRAVRIGTPPVGNIVVAATGCGMPWKVSRETA